VREGKQRIKGKEQKYQVITYMQIICEEIE